MLIRDAEPTRDSGACSEIYSPFVIGSAVSMEERAPDEREFALRIERISRTHPWLVAERALSAATSVYRES